MNSKIDSTKQTTIDEAEKLGAKIDEFGDKLNTTMTTIKVVAALLCLVVLLSMFGAKLINYWESRQPRDQRTAIEESIEDLQKANEEILKRIEELHKESENFKEGLEPLNGSE
jgi:hypothetical protein